MFEVSVEHTFAAAHFLRDYKGKCENLHGHNYKVEVKMTGEKLDRAGMLVDFTDLKRELRATCEPLDHIFLNETEPFTTLNPSAENIAWFICEKLQESLRPYTSARISEVKVWETAVQWASYRPSA